MKYRFTQNTQCNCTVAPIKANVCRNIITLKYFTLKRSRHSLARISHRLKSHAITKMNIFRILLQLIFILRVQSIGQTKTNTEIIIMYSIRQPFVMESDVRGSQLKGLDVSVVENFARKFQVKTKYIRSNESLNTVFNTEGAVQHFIANPSFE